MCLEHILNYLKKVYTGGHIDVGHNSMSYDKFREDVRRDLGKGKLGDGISLIIRLKIVVSN